MIYGDREVDDVLKYTCSSCIYVEGNLIMFEGEIGGRVSFRQYDVHSRILCFKNEMD